MSIPGSKGEKRRSRLYWLLAPRQGFACLLCGGPLRRWTVEHVVPRSRGGNGHPSNTGVSCKACNNRRGDAPLTPAQQERWAQALAYGARPRAVAQ